MDSVVTSGPLYPLDPPEQIVQWPDLLDQSEQLEAWDLQGAVERIARWLDPLDLQDVME